jgi:catechol 2,3-dioxygenase-like lactoylglutathione lyase family enzyme
MQIRISSVMVQDQDHALAFYTGTLGFVKHADIMVGGAYRWLTVTSPDGAEGVQLALEPTGFAPAQVYQRALYEAGIPNNAFLTEDIEAEYRRLKERGVVFRSAPAPMGPIISAVFEDTCGNLINLAQPVPPTPSNS